MYDVGFNHFLFWHEPPFLLTNYVSWNLIIKKLWISSFNFNNMAFI